MFSQKSNGDVDVDGGGVRGEGGPLIKIKVYHRSSQHVLLVPALSCFGDLKKILSPLTGLDPDDQRLLFRGNEKDNDDYLQAVGVKDSSKLALLENPASKEKKLEEMKRKNEISIACNAVADVREEVDLLTAMVASIELTVCGGTKLADKEFVILTESLMVQLLKLDGIMAEGKARLERKNEVQRVQSLVDAVDDLKMRNSDSWKLHGVRDDDGRCSAWGAEASAPSSHEISVNNSRRNDS